MKHKKKHKNNRLIGPQEKHGNQIREIDLEKIFQKVKPLANFPNIHMITHSIRFLKNWIEFNHLFQRPS